MLTLFTVVWSEGRFHGCLLVPTQAGGQCVPKTGCTEFDGVRTKIVSCCATSFDPKYSLLDSHHKWIMFAQEGYEDATLSQHDSMLEKCYSFKYLICSFYFLWVPALYGTVRMQQWDVGASVQLCLLHFSVYYISFQHFNTKYFWNCLVSDKFTPYISK